MTVFVRRGQALESLLVHFVSFICSICNLTTQMNRNVITIALCLVKANSNCDGNYNVLMSFHHPSGNENLSKIFWHAFLFPEGFPQRLPSQYHIYSMHDSCGMLNLQNQCRSNPSSSTFSFYDRC